METEIRKWKAEIHAFALLKEECLDQGYSLFEHIPKNIQSLKHAWDQLPQLQKEDFLNRIAAEEHLIASIKHKTQAADYSPINYYESYLS